MKTYQVGEVVLMEWHGWLKAFRVVRVAQVDAETIEYQLTMCENENDPGWIKPG